MALFGLASRFVSCDCQITALAKVQIGLVCDPYLISRSSGVNAVQARAGSV